MSFMFHTPRWSRAFKRSRSISFARLIRIMWSSTRPAVRTLASATCKRTLYASSSPSTPCYERASSLRAWRSAVGRSTPRGCAMEAGRAPDVRRMATPGGGWAAPRASPGLAAVGESFFWSVGIRCNFWRFWGSLFQQVLNQFLFNFFLWISHLSIWKLWNS